VKNLTGDKIMPLMTQQPVPVVDFGNDLLGHHEDFDFFDFLNGFNHHDTQNTDCFIHRKGITFQEYVGRQFITGNELVYYPKLAEKLREMTDYPVLKRCYEVDQTITGLAFLKYFYDHSMEHLKNFQIELEQCSN